MILLLYWAPPRRTFSFSLATATLGLCNAPGLAPEASWPQQRSRTLQLLLTGLCNAPVTLPGAVTAVSRPLQRSWNASGHCNCCSLGHEVLLQRSRTLQLLLMGPRSAPSTLLDAATLLDVATSLLGPRNAPATLPDVATSLLGPRNAPATL